MDLYTAMKVRELIETLQKQNPEDEIHILIDANVHEWAEDENEQYYAKNIEIKHDTYYQDDCDITDLDTIEENLIEYYDEDISADQLYEYIDRNYISIEGCWVKIKP